MDSGKNCNILISDIEIGGNMGVWLQHNHINVSEKTETLVGVIQNTGYRDINSEFVEKVRLDNKIKYVQISTVLPDEAYQKIDSILAARPDMKFRIFGLYGYEKYDISFLKKMPHLRHLIIGCHLRNTPDLIDFNLLKELKLKSLFLNAFDLKDYGFMQHLDEEIESIGIMADTVSGNIEFDCKWLLKYPFINELWLGKKANKNIACLAEMKNLKHLTLRGIKIKDFSYLMKMELEKLALLWNGNDDLHELADLKSLKEIELWRINKLSDISFLSALENLEIIKLQDLKHISKLPDLSNLKNIREIIIDNTGIAEGEIDGGLKPFVTFYR